MALLKMLQSYSVPDCNEAKFSVSVIACLFDNRKATPVRHVGPAQPPVPVGHSALFVPFCCKERQIQREGLSLHYAVSGTNRGIRCWTGGALRLKLIRVAWLVRRNVTSLRL